MTSDALRASRRRFIASAASAVGLAACGVKPDAPLDVVVVGAGLAGLAAALELEKAGFNVQVIESEPHVGGRVRTLRGALDHDVWLDVGAQGGSDQYAHFTRYCRQLVLSLTSTPRPSTRPDTLLQLDGAQYLLSALRAAPARWPVNLTDAEKARAPMRLLSSVLLPIAKTVGSTERVLHADFADYDKLSLKALLQQEGFSADALALVEHTVNYNSLDSVSSLSAIRDTTRFLTPGKSVFVDGGNGRLPVAMAKQLKRPVALGSQLIALDQDTDHVALRTMSRGVEQTLWARQVVLAIPFTALRRVRITPELPAEKKRIVNELPYTQVAKTFVQTRTAFLNGSPRIGAVYSDSAFERVFNMSDGTPQEPGLLLNWVNGKGLHDFDGLAPQAHQRRVLQWMRELWPQHAGELGDSLTFNWADTPARGAYAHYAPGQLTRYATIIPAAVDRLHFAGEHTELVAPGMEGALTSGVRVAREIVEVTTA